MLEAMAAVWAMLHFKQYLRNAHFILETDQTVLKWLNSRKGNLGAMTKWVVESQAFSYTVVHVAGRRHHGPDLMSRSGARHSEVCAIVREFEDTEYSYAATRVVDVREIPAQWVSLTPNDIPRKLGREDWVREQEACPALQKLVLTAKEFQNTRKKIIGCDLS